LCVFDLDHTLVRTPLDLVAVAADMRRLIERARGPLPVRPERYRVFELVAWSKSRAPELEPAVWAVALDHEGRAMEAAALEPGALDAVAGARRAGFQTALWTNNARVVTLPALERLGLAALLDLVVTRDDMSALKPDQTGGASSRSVSPTRVTRWSWATRGWTASRPRRSACRSSPTAPTRRTSHAGASRRSPGWRIWHGYPSGSPPTSTGTSGRDGPLRRDAARGALHGRAGAPGAARRPDAPARARRGPGAGASARRGKGLAVGNRDGRAPLDDPLGAARLRQDDARQADGPHDRRPLHRLLRGARGRERDPRGGRRGGARTRASADTYDPLR